jgi:hypothetical protein
MTKPVPAPMYKLSRPQSGVLMVIMTGEYRRPVMTPVMASAGSAESHDIDHLVTMSKKMTTAIPRCQNRFIRGQASNKTENTANQPPASALEKSVP